MKILDNSSGKIKAINTNEIQIKDLSCLNNELVIRIINLLKEKPDYPKQLAKRLKIHEQNVYYYIRKLEKAKIIKVVKQERLQGTIAKFYALSSDSFFVKIKDFEEKSKLYEKESEFLKPFIQDGRLNSLIIVGSPDPHGPEKARSKDGYFGMDLALFLGGFLESIKESKVKLDTEVQERDISENNLIVLGGPIVNNIAKKIGKKAPIYFDEKNKSFYSTLSKKSYAHDEIGVINKFQSPFNKKKEILYIAGIRNSGTKAAIIAFIKKFSEIEKGNSFDKAVKSKVAEGLDFNSDGVVDDVEILE